VDNIGLGTTGYRLSYLLNELHNRFDDNVFLSSGPEQYFLECIDTAITSNKLINIIEKHNLTLASARHVLTWLNGEIDWYNLSDEVRNNLYAQYIHEMPYGIAKGRTGKPDVWLSEHISYIIDFKDKR
jgi:hypothetical protein